MTGRFPAPYAGYDVLDKWNTPSFNDQTREVLEARGRVPSRSFFEPHEWDVLEALCDTVMPQPDRVDPVPIAPWIDADLDARRGSGTRYADMPAGGDAWRQGLAALDAEARARHDADFPGLGRADRAAILTAADDGDLADAGAWDGLPARRFLRDTAFKQIAAIYYAHPAGQSEIGYGGPASPRGYVRLSGDRHDLWEAPRGRWPDRGAR